MKISIIIVNYRGWKHLQVCLESLTNQVENYAATEVIVVDNYSNDGQLEIFKDNFKTVKFILNKSNSGFSHACNVGAKHANGKYFLFLNSDIIANNEAILGLKNILIYNPDLTLVSCQQYNNSGKKENPFNLFPSFFTLNNIPRAIYKLIHKNRLSKKYNSKDSLIYPDWVSGSVMMLSSENFNKLVGWCEDYWLYYEDVDLCKQIYDNGGKIALSNHFSMIHNHGGATRINIKTSALTKAEVLISRHVYVSRHFNHYKSLLLHTFCIAENMISLLIPFLLSIPFFFLRKLVVYRGIYKNLSLYYIECIYKNTWMSNRAPNFEKH